MEKAQYARLSSSSTDDEEKSIKYDSPAEIPTQTPLSHVRFSRSPFFYLLDLGLILAFTFFLIRRNAESKVARLDLQDDITGYAPKFGHQLVTFKTAPQFISNHTSLASLAEAREYWKTLVPRKSMFNLLMITEPTVWKQLDKASSN